VAPFLRVIRDKRGYETTYLMHLYREGHRQRSRILYVFRTPGGVRVGRDPLDQDVRNRLEDRYEEIDFDWNAIREAKQQIEMAEPRRRRPPRRAGAAATPPAPSPPPAAGPEPEAAPRSGQVPAAIEGATPDEQMAFLSHWYPIVLERIPRRTADPTRLEALTALAERLNPATWTDADEIAAGLPQAAEAIERLSRVFSRRRRRPRRRPDASSGGSETPPAGSETPPAGSETPPED
jgi:hypothetical protein